MSTNNNCTSQHTFTTTAKLKPCNILKAFFFPVKYMWLLQFLVCLFLENSVGHKNLYFLIWNVHTIQEGTKFSVYACGYVCTWARKRKTVKGDKNLVGFVTYLQFYLRTASKWFFSILRTLYSCDYSCLLS